MLIQALMITLPVGLAFYLFSAAKQKVSYMESMITLRGMVKECIEIERQHLKGE